ncbi:golvesin C-terminal-like domain-containing protein [Streptomyces halobius]|uniref:Golvesin/Xly CBD-like domain-containing protein n=1 Tax=Streptomyces halobius TaxID=2879846 RepID=A0ABY4MEZ3_9ACTN|nr:hypothetical protein [Streptomyces halobius]UQA95683.1 hypothetical protein K9S39_30880 [Streptomyces halobius]
MAMTTSLVSTASAGERTVPKSAADALASDAPAPQGQPKPSAIPVEDRKGLLGADYTKSSDRIVTLSGDGTGLHVLTGKAKDGYALKTAATLFEDGFASDTWIGNHCVTESGKYAAVAYAPRMFTNKPELMVRGAFTTIVNLDTGKVTKLPHTATLAYFSPGCGNGDTAVFSQMTWDGDTKQQTRLISVDAKTGKAAQPVAFPGQVTSAIPTKDGIVAAHGNKLVRINGTKEKVLVRTKTVPFQLTADADGGVTFIDRELDDKTGKKPLSRAKRVTGTSKPTTLAEGKLTDWDLTRSADGTAFITGKATTKTGLPKAVKKPGGLTKGALISTTGKTAHTSHWADGKTTLINPKDASKPRPARLKLTALATKKTTELDITPSTQSSGKTSPTLSGPKPQGGTNGEIDEGGMSTQTFRTQVLTGFTDPVVGDPNNPSEKADERTCAVQRNSVKLQAFQPTPRQIEWAVDQAIVGELNFYRAANWKNTGVGGYQPQGLFPAKPLAGDPNGTLDNEDPDVTDKWHIPAQVMLGITAQESNMWQATRFAVPGVTANPLIGNYYGVDYAASGEQLDPWRINWFDADCGYGITQATDGMRLPNKGQSTLSPLAQKAVAVDYTANIAAGAQILSEKWNETYNAGMKINGGHPRWIENWFFALWAYNSGFYPSADAAGHKGVGWTNNPANPLWKSNRTPFLENVFGNDDYSHAAHPQDWPYEEKVIGWAGHPIEAMFAPGDFQAGYRYAWWGGAAGDALTPGSAKYNRARAKPPVDLFCDASNNCDPAKIGENDSNDPGQGACNLDANRDDPHWLHCWWDKPISPDEWKDCNSDSTCGNAVHRFTTSYGEQPDANSYPPRCDTGLPTNALIVDDVQNGVTPAGVDANRGCGAIKSDGTFTFDFTPWQTTMERPDESTLTMNTYPGKIDTHQIGAGYGNHFWFTHTRTPESYPANANRLKVTGTWKLNGPINNTSGQAKVFAHIPDHGAQTKKATYWIKTDEGEIDATISQKANQSNKWVDLGAYYFKNTTPEVRLDNFNGGTGDADIAFDAIAFVPGTYNGTKFGTYPLPNPSAADPEPIEPSEEISGGFFPALPGTRSTTSASTMSLSSPTSCSIASVSIERKRANACIHDTLYVTHFENGKPDGTASFDYYNTIYLDPKSAEFSQVTTLSLKSMNGAMNTVNLDYRAKCRGYCAITSTNWDGSKTWKKGDTLRRTITTRMKWTPSQDTTNTITPYWTFAGSTNGDPIRNPLEVEKSQLDIRCDNQVINAGTGCVFSGYKPTYVMNSKKFRGAAAHIALMWDKTKIVYGKRSSGKPLKYLADKMSDDGSGKTQHKRNRQKICKRKWRTYAGTGLFTDLWGTTDSISCDEFAFANAYQSGGNPNSNGGTNPVDYSGAECVQTYIKRNSDDTISIHLRPDYPAPNWSEPCGRSSMSNWQNTQSMRPFGDFIKEQRLMQDDQYWVDLDGFTL